MQNGSFSACLHTLTARLGEATPSKPAGGLVDEICMPRKKLQGQESDQTNRGTRDRRHISPVPIPEAERPIRMRGLEGRTARRCCYVLRCRRVEAAQAVLREQLSAPGPGAKL